MMTFCRRLAVGTRLSDDRQIIVARHFAERGGDTGAPKIEDVRLGRQIGLLCSALELIAGGSRGCPELLAVLGDDGGADAVEDRAGVDRLIRKSDAGQTRFEQAGDRNCVVPCCIARRIGFEIDEDVLDHAALPFAG